jgi:hypothetical protein
LAVLGLAPSTASALSEQITLQDPARVITDEGGTGETGNFLSFTDAFASDYIWDGPDRLLVTLNDFSIPQTNAIGGEFYSFRLEDPNNPGSFVPTRDLQLEWDIPTGVMASETFRAEMNYHGGSDPTSYFDLTLTTEGVGMLFCPDNTHPAIAGLNLPAGSSQSADLLLAASACAVTEMGVTNQLPDNILALKISAHLPEPASGLLVGAGLVALAVLRRRPRPFPDTRF